MGLFHLRFHKNKKCATLVYNFNGKSITLDYVQTQIHIRKLKLNQQCNGSAIGERKGQIRYRNKTTLKAK